MEYFYWSANFAWRSFPTAGPAVGPGGSSGPPPVGRNFDPAKFLEWFSPFLNTMLFTVQNLASKSSCNIEVQNQLILQSQALEKKALCKYKGQRKRFHEYQAATRLWASGMDWQEAIGIIQQAFNACIQGE